MEKSSRPLRRHGAQNPARRTIFTQTREKRGAGAMLASRNERAAPRYSHLVMVRRGQHREAAQSQRQETGRCPNRRWSLGIGDFRLGNRRLVRARKNSTLDTAARLDRKSVGCPWPAFRAVGCRRRRRKHVVAG